MKKTERKVETRTYLSVSGIVCDICSVLYTDEEDLDFMHEIIVAINPDQCVSLRVRRDVCRKCYLQYIEDTVNPLLVSLKVDGDHGTFDSNEDD